MALARRPLIARAAALVAVAALLAAGCGGGHRRGPASSQPTAGRPPSTDPKYQRAIDAAAGRGLQVWLEADLVKRWLAGRESFDQGVQRLGVLAARHGVVGVKIADELAYGDGLDDPAKVRAFLADSAAALRRAAPGKQLLVDLLVPELGCAPGLSAEGAAAAACRARAERQYPALTLTQVDGYLAAGDLDAVDLSIGLLSESTYRGWGIDRDQAALAAWAEVRRRGWGAHLRLQARKALAHPGDYRGDAASAEADVHTFVDLPRQAGAAAIDVWTWKQKYRGDIVRLMDPGNHDNALWDALRQRHDAGVPLLTHFSPSQTERGLDADMDQLAQVFTGVFAAAGLG